MQVAGPVAVVWDGGRSLGLGSCLWAVGNCAAAACEKAHLSEIAVPPKHPHIAAVLQRGVG